jgi:hypothetical protein
VFSRCRLTIGIALSDLGLKGYQSYWASTLVSYFATRPVGESVSINDISTATYITPEDVAVTLAYMGVIKEGGDGSKHVRMDSWHRGADPAYALNAEGIFIPET